MSSAVTVEPIHEPDGSAMDGDERKEGRWTTVELCSKRRASQHGGRKEQRMKRQGSASKNDVCLPLAPIYKPRFEHGGVGSFALAFPTTPQ